jgi:hypothetical protein
MTGAVCRPMNSHPPVAEVEQRPDRFAELLECLADLLVEARRQRVEIGQTGASEDPRARELITRITELERLIGKVGVEAASVHQLLQHVHLI